MPFKNIDEINDFCSKLSYILNKCFIDETLISQSNSDIVDLKNNIELMIFEVLNSFVNNKVITTSVEIETNPGEYLGREPEQTYSVNIEMDKFNLSPVLVKPLDNFQNSSLFS